MAITPGPPALVTIASRRPLSDVVVNFGDPPSEARIVAATVDGIRVVSLYAPNGRALGSPTYAAKLAWFGRFPATTESIPSTLSAGIGSLASRS